MTVNNENQIGLRYLEESNKQREWNASFNEMVKEMDALSQEIEEKKAQGKKSLEALDLEFSRIQEVINLRKF